MPNSASGFSTSLSLIQRAQAMESDAWSSLVQLYGPLIYSWARRHGFQSDDAADLVQSVFLAVWNGLPKFSFDRPDASFRGWLRTITSNAIHQCARYQKTRPQVRQLSSELLENTQLQSLAIGDDEDVFQALTQRALDLVRESVDESTWTAFWQLTIEEIPVKDVAETLGLSVAAVRQAKYRVLCRLREFIADR